MQIDHLFVFTKAADAAAEELLAFGLTEGSNRVHPGQGTANRKFYFENFFLELLWVHNEAELCSPTTLPSKLWQRAHFREQNASPYGLCLVNTPDTDALFALATRYYPSYLPAGLAIDVLAQEHNLSLPWTFRLPFPGKPTAPAEPTRHRNGLQRLTRAEFGLARYEASDGFVQSLAGQPQLHFAAAAENRLDLVFDENRQGQSRHFGSLNLHVYY